MGKGSVDHSFSVDNPDETLVQIGHYFYHTSGCMVVLQGETDEAAMYASKGISQVQPAHS